MIANYFLVLLLGAFLSCVKSGEDRCSLPKKSGMCLAYMRRFYFDQAAGKCKSFIYGGCRGNDNNFHTEEACIVACGGSRGSERKEAKASAMAVLETEEEPAPETCNAKKKVGPCRGLFPRFYFNPGSGKCEVFIYGGCNGNENNFNSQEQCEEACARH